MAANVDRNKRGIFGEHQDAGAQGYSYQQPEYHEHHDRFIPYPVERIVEKIVDRPVPQVIIEIYKTIVHFG